MGHDFLVNQQDALPNAQAPLVIDVAAPDAFTALMAMPVTKLDADQYSAEDLHGVTESLFGFGNLNFLLLQGNQSNEAATDIGNAAITGSATNIPLSAGASVLSGQTAMTPNDLDSFSTNSNLAIERSPDRHSGSNIDFHATEGSIISVTAGAVASAAPNAAHTALSATSLQSFGGGQPGITGAQGDNGSKGSGANDGQNGHDGNNGIDGSNGSNGQNGSGGISNCDNNHDNHNNYGCHDSNDSNINITLNAGDIISTVTSIVNSTISNVTGVLHGCDVTNLLSAVTNTVDTITNNVVSDITHVADNLLTAVTTDVTHITSTALNDVTNILHTTDNTATNTVGNLLTDVLGGNGALTHVLTASGDLGHTINAIASPALDLLGSHGENCAGNNLTVNVAGAIGGLDLPAVHIDVPLPAAVGALTGSINVDGVADVLHTAGNPVNLTADIGTNFINASVNLIDSTVDHNVTSQISDVTATVSNAGHDATSIVVADATEILTPVANTVDGITSAATDNAHALVSNVTNSEPTSNIISDITGITGANTPVTDLANTLTSTVADISHAQNISATAVTSLTIDNPTIAVDATVDAAINLLHAGNTESSASTDILGSLTNNSQAGDSGSANITWPESTVTDIAHAAATADIGALASALPTPIGSIAEGLGSILNDHAASSSHHHGLL